MSVSTVGHHFIARSFSGGDGIGQISTRPVLSHRSRFLAKDKKTGYDGGTMAETTGLQKTTPADKLPPQNLEAEMSLLGSLMLDVEAITKVVDFLEPRDFYKPNHKSIYEAMVDLFDKGVPIDLLSIAARLKEKKVLEAVGGNSYLTELINTVPTAAHVHSYAAIVQKKRILRDLISASYEIGLLGYEDVEDADVLVDRAETKIFTIAQKSLSQVFTPIKESLESAFERLDKLSKN